MGVRAGIGILMGSMAGLLGLPVGAQQAQLTDVAVRGLIYEPQRLPSTDALESGSGAISARYTFGDMRVHSLNAREKPLVSRHPMIALIS